MTKDLLSTRELVSKAAAAGSPTRISVVAVGDTRQWNEAGASLPKDVKVAFAAIEDITDDFLAIVEPETVISPLLARSFDCADLAERLHMYGFRGRYRAIAADIPNPGLIRREVREAFPGLDFEIISDVAFDKQLLS